MLKYLRRCKDRKGFTLVEVIIVLVIIAILSAVLIPSLSGYIDRANKAKYMLAAKNCMKAMQIELSEMYAEKISPFDIKGIKTCGKSENLDVSFIGTDFAKEVLQTADDEPYILLFGLGNYKTYISTSERSKAYTVYFVAYVRDQNSRPIYFNGSEWTTKYPWEKDYGNTFKVNGEDILLEFYFVAGPDKNNAANNWTKLKQIRDKFKD
ncbi:MAG: prepilin-type N-terminal cleavage/methylation domain-containing protein [Oscillospiraceae bacterium]